MNLNNLYSGDYKRYMLLPIGLFIVFLVLVLVAPGLKLGIDLKGGTSIIVRAEAPMDATVLERTLKAKYSLEELQVSSVSSPGSHGLNIQYSKEASLEKAESLLLQAKAQLKPNPEAAKQAALQSISTSSKFVSEAPDASGLGPEQSVELAESTFNKAVESFNLSLQGTIRQTFGLGDDIKMQRREVGATLGSSFYSQGIMVAIIAFLLVTMVVFAFFRELVPSAAIIGAMVFDIVAAMGLMAVFGIPVSLSTIPALLMLIGYSIDTDILLTTRVLKRKDGTPADRSQSSMVTGMAMTGTMLAALVSMLVLSYIWQIQVVFEISAVLFFGLSADIISTWLMNAPMLLWYVESKAKPGQVGART